LAFWRKRLGDGTGLEPWSAVRRASVSKSRCRGARSRAFEEYRDGSAIRLQSVGKAHLQIAATAALAASLWLVAGAAVA